MTRSILIRMMPVLVTAAVITSACSNPTEPSSATTAQPGASFETKCEGQGANNISCR